MWWAQAEYRLADSDRQHSCAHWRRSQSQVVTSRRAAGRRLSRGPLLGESWLRSHAGRAREIHGWRGLRARRKTLSNCWRVSSGNVLAGKESSTVGLSPKKAGPTQEKPVPSVITLVIEREKGHHLQNHRKRHLIIFFKMYLF